MRILHIEDDPVTSRTVGMVLTSADHAVHVTDLGEEGIDMARLYNYDLLILELDLPDMSGFEVLRQIRLAHVDTPVLVLTGADDTESKLKAFGFGADDYMTKPFHREELIARVEAILRRSKGHSQLIIRTGNLGVNLDEQTVSLNGDVVLLTSKEYQILELLLLHKGRILTKEIFMNHLYSGIDETELRIIDIFIANLRKKLGAAGSMIETVWGRGYRLGGTK